MDEASIVSALQSNLQDYKVKTQIRRKESQLHVLITRDDDDELDYSSLYSIVKRCIDELAIAGARDLVVYGRLAGAKHPEWQKSAEIKPPLPLIELDLDDLEDIGEISSLTFPVNSDETELQDSNLSSSHDDEYNSFKTSIENDLKDSTKDFISHDDLTVSEDDHLVDLYRGELSELHLDEFTLSEANDHGLTPIEVELNSYQSAPSELVTMPTDGLSNANIKTIESELFELPSLPMQDRAIAGFTDDDFFIDTPTVAHPMPPLPPLPPTKRKPLTEVKTPDLKFKQPHRVNSSPLISIGFGVITLSVLGVCGWLVWDRSVQQKYLVEARNLESQNLSSQKITNLNILAEKRNQLQTVISQLQGIPDYPASLYADAQVEIKNLSPKLQEFDRQVILEQSANKNLEFAKNTTLEAAKLVQNPPHKSTVWKSAQNQRQQALKALQEVPPESLLYNEAQTRLKNYGAELLQINKWVDIQSRAESLVNNVNPIAVKQLQEVKAKAPDKSKFLEQCQPIMRSQIFATDAQRVSLSLPNLTDYLCAYFWDS